MKGTAERGCRAPGEPCGGSFHSPVGWLTLTGQLEDSLPRETLNGKNRTRGCGSTRTLTHTHLWKHYMQTHTHTPLCLDHKIISFSICHTITEPLFIDLYHDAFSPGNRFFGSRRRNIAQTARLGAVNPPSCSHFFFFSHRTLTAQDSTSGCAASARGRERLPDSHDDWIIKEDNWML